MKFTIPLLVFFSLFSSVYGQANCMNIADFGVLVNSNIDNSDSLQKAINTAASLGATLCFQPGVYKYTKPLVVPAGVSLNGAGMGSNATSTPYNGTILWYSGDSVALTITGTNVSLGNLTLYNYGGAAKKGIKIQANAKLVESVTLSKIQLYGFTSGSALMLKAENAGGIAYASFYDVRVRHAKIGIEVLEADNTSFINSNTFFHGVVSGGGFDYAVLVNGGNNNVFNATVIEPQSSGFGHLVVNDGQIIGENIRIEAVQQTNGVPVVKFGVNASQSRISGFYAGGLIVNNGNNIVELASSNTIGEQNSNVNLFINAAFNCYSTNNIPDFWAISNTSARLSYLTEEALVGQKVINVKVPPGQLFEMYPKSENAPKLTAYSMYKYCNFSVLTRTNVPNKVKLTYNYSGGLITSVANSGAGNWETIGLQSLTSTAINPNPKIHIDNTTGADSLSVDITSPAFCFGQNIPNRDVAPLSSAGGQVAGLLSTSVSNIYSFISGTTYLLLHRNANVFIISNSGTTISRINHLTADRFLKGSVVTLLFNNNNIVVQNSAYLSLKSSFTSASANTSLTLMANGDGTWREVNRNN
jgi:hypothetical protein